MVEKWLLLLAFIEPLSVRLSSIRRLGFTHVYIDFTSKEMFSRGCARVSRTISSHSQLLLSFLHEVQLYHSTQSYVPRDIRAKSLISNEIFITGSRALHDVGHQVESHRGSVLEVQLDPFSLVADELAVLANRLQRMIVAEVPKLASDAEHFFKKWVKGKRFQPTVLLLTSALNVPTSFPASSRSVDALQMEFPSGRHCIAEVAEMMHIYNTIRHDILDDVNTRYRTSSLNFVIETKLSVLVGDFLLSKIFVILASLENTEVQSVLLKVVEHLVIGETMEMTYSSEQLYTVENYMERTYYKKASLMANSCKAIAFLAGTNLEATRMAYDYGKYLGFAYQLMDDILDLTSKSASCGKQSLADVRHGILGAPMVFAIEEFPQLRAIIDRGFDKQVDVDIATEYLQKSRGMQRTRELAAKYANLALASIETLPRSDDNACEQSRQALVDLAQRVTI